MSRKVVEVDTLALFAKALIRPCRSTINQREESPGACKATTELRLMRSSGNTRWGTMETADGGRSGALHVVFAGRGTTVPIITVRILSPGWARNPAAVQSHEVAPWRGIVWVMFVVELRHKALSGKSPVTLPPIGVVF